MHHNRPLTEIRITYYAFVNFKKYYKLATMEDAIALSPVYIFKETFGYWENIGHKNKKYSYVIYDGNGSEVLEICMKKGNETKWRLQNLTVEMNYYFQVQDISFDVVDSYGSKWGHTFGGGHPGIANAMLYLHQATDYNNRREFEFAMFTKLREINNISIQPFNE